MVCRRRASRSALLGLLGALLLQLSAPARAAEPGTDSPVVSRRDTGASEVFADQKGATNPFPDTVATDLRQGDPLTPTDDTLIRRQPSRRDQPGDIGDSSDDRSN